MRRRAAATAARRVRSGAVNPSYQSRYKIPCTGFSFFRYPCYAYGPCNKGNISKSAGGFQGNPLSEMSGVKCVWNSYPLQATTVRPNASMRLYSHG